MPLPSCDPTLFADAEAGKDPPQQILAGELAADLIQRPLRDTQLLGHEFSGSRLLHTPRGLLHAAPRTCQPLEVPLTRRDTAALEGVIPHARLQVRPQHIQSLA